MESATDIATQNKSAADAATAPSLLRQIVDAADSLTDEQKQKVLWQIKMQKALKAAEELDRIIAAGNVLVKSEDEIAEIVSKYRREKYEASLRD